MIVWDQTQLFSGYTKIETVLGAPSLYLAMNDPPFKQCNKCRRNSIESTFTKESDDNALAPLTMTHKKKLKKI